MSTGSYVNRRGGDDVTKLNNVVIRTMDEKEQREFIRNMKDIIDGCSKRWREYQLLLTLLTMSWYTVALIQEISGIILTNINWRLSVIQLIISFIASPSIPLLYPSPYHYIPITLLSIYIIISSLINTYNISIMDHEDAVKERINKRITIKTFTIIIIYIIIWIISYSTSFSSSTTTTTNSSSSGSIILIRSWVLLLAAPITSLFGLFVQHSIYNAHLGILKLSQLKYSSSSS